MHKLGFLLLTFVTLVYAVHQPESYPELTRRPGAAIPGEFLDKIKNVHNDLKEYEDKNVMLDLLQLHKEGGATAFLENIRSANLKLSRKCQRDWTRYKLALLAAGTENGTFIFPIWSGRMFDSTGFIDPGILDGNFLFEGRYSECKRAKAIADVNVDTVQGMYCIAYWLENLQYLRWQKIGQGICVPDSCTDVDVWELIYNVYRPNFANKDVTWPTLRCEREQPELKSDPEAIITIIIMSLFGLLVMLATVYHYYMVEIEGDLESEKTKPIPKNKVKNEAQNMETYLEPKPQDDEYEIIQNGKTNQGFQAENGEKPLQLKDLNAVKHDDMPDVKESPSNSFNLETSDTKKPMSSLNILEKLLLTFSMYITVPLISSTKQPKGTYLCLNGLRFVAMAWIILGHTYSLGTILEWPPTMENEFAAASNFLKAGYTKIMTIDVYVDTFFILSAFLMTISLLRKLKKKDGNLGIFGWFMHFFGRYWRLTPTYFIVLMMFTNLWHYFGDGPFMKQYVSDVDACESAWWVNLLYINNLYLGQGWCFGWSWYLCIDWQFYCMAPIFLYVLWRWEKFGICFNIAGFCGGMIANFVLWHKFTTQGPDTPEDEVISDFYDIYIVPWTRCPVYFMGMMLGWVFYKTDGNIKLPKIVVIIGWIVALAMFGIVSYIPHLNVCTDPGCRWSSTEYTIYYSLNRPMWGIWVCWLILACSQGYGGFVNKFLSWNFFVPLGKLTYLGYLIHPILCLLFFYRAPLQQYYSDYFLMYLFCANLLITMVLSFIMCFSVSAPLMGILAVFLSGKKT